ncbi:MAG: hypothetical protein ABR607_17140, partial [Pyrinomonadaceae bacterium]
MTELAVATKKGLFVLDGEPGAGFEITARAFAGEPVEFALRDRRMLSADGIFIVVATVSEQDGSSVATPEVLARGVPFLTAADDPFVDELRGAVEDSLDRAAEQQAVEDPAAGSAAEQDQQRQQLAG